MALADVIVRELAVTLDAILRGQGAARDLRQAVVQATTRFKIGDPGEVLRVFGIARQVNAVLNAGRDLGQLPSLAPLPSALPIDPSLSSTDPLYHYHLLVVGTTPEGTRFAEPVHIYTDDLLSEEQLFARLDQQTSNPAFAQSLKSGPAEGIAGTVWEYFVLGAGRRR